MCGKGGVGGGECVGGVGVCGCERWEGCMECVSDSVIGVDGVVCVMGYGRNE